MLSSHSYVTVQVAGDVNWRTLGVDDIAAGVSSELNTSWPLAVRDLTVQPDQDLAGQILAGQILHFTYHAVAVVQTLGDFASEDDVAAIVAGAFQHVTGAAPRSRSATVATSWTPAVVKPATNPLDDLIASVKGLFTGLQSDVQLVLWAVVAIVVVLAFAIAWGPNTAQLARIQL